MDVKLSEEVSGSDGNFRLLDSSHAAGYSVNNLIKDFHPDYMKISNSQVFRIQ